MSKLIKGATLISGSQAASISASQCLDGIDNIGIQAIYGSGGNGTLKLQASNDNVNWSDIAGSPVALAGASGNTVWTVTTPAYRYINVVWLRTSGTMTLTVIVNGICAGWC